MRIYLSSFTEKALVSYLELFKDAKLNILISFALRRGDYYKLIKKYKNNINSLILDSGAYTINNAMSQKLCQKSDFSGYKEYCKAFDGMFDFVFNFDVDFTPNGFGVNLSYLNKLENDGILAVPVVHDYLGREADFYAKEHYEIVALGFSDDKKKENIDPIVQRLHVANKKVHLLGVSNYIFLYDLPVAYCDSSSWGQNQRYACISYWCVSKPGLNKTETIHMKVFDVAPVPRKNWYDDYKYRNDLENYLKINFDYNYYDLLDVDIGWQCRQVVNIHHFVKLQEIITQEHEKRGWNFPV